MHFVLEFSQVGVSKDSPENRSEVAQHGKEMIPYCRFIFIEQENISQIEREHSYTTKHKCMTIE